MEAGHKFIAGAPQLLDDAVELLQSMDDISDLRRDSLKIGVAPAAFLYFLCIQ
jgi:DNA-binding transcriptional LysR family regulator